MMASRLTSRISQGFAVGLLAMLAAACGTKPASPVKSTRPGVSSSMVSGGTTAQSAPAITTWDDSLGNLIAVMSTERGTPVVFSRDPLPTTPHTVELFSHDAQLQPGILVPGPASRACAREHGATITTPSRPGVPVWSTALDSGIAKPTAIDGLDDLAPRDSGAMIVRLRRLAGTIPEDSTSAPFRGLPVVIREAWRVLTPEGTPVWITLSTRTLGTESNPRLEILTMIAEPDPPSRDAWRIAWSRRESGPEDRVVGADVLAALTLRGVRTVVVLSRSGDLGEEIEILDRTQPGSWRLRWSSTALGCALP